MDQKGLAGSDERQTHAKNANSPSVYTPSNRIAKNPHVSSCFHLQKRNQISPRARLDVHDDLLHERDDYLEQAGHKLDAHGYERMQREADLGEVRCADRSTSAKNELRERDGDGLRVAEQC